jgi:hypothetical protein
MLHSAWYPRNWVRPDEAARTWDFTLGGLLKWSTDFPGMKFIKRGYGYNKKEIHDFVKMGLGVVLQVDNFHWVAVWWWSIWDEPVVFDPIDGHILWNWKWRYKKITGYALFQREEF